LLDLGVGEDRSKNPNLLEAALAGGWGPASVQDGERDRERPV
jgi:hypothetical protein